MLSTGFRSKLRLAAGPLLADLPQECDKGRCKFNMPPVNYDRRFDSFWLSFP
jgi:hypothetical protein